MNQQAWTHNEMRRLRYHLNRGRYATEISQMMKRSRNSIQSKISRTPSLHPQRQHKLFHLHAKALGELLGVDRGTVLHYIRAGLFPFPWREKRTRVHVRHYASDEDIHQWARTAEYLYFIDTSKLPTVDNWLSKQIKKTLANWGDRWLRFDEVENHLPISEETARKWARETAAPVKVFRRKKRIKLTTITAIFNERTAQ